jgi:YVTN family beta-propeller protein
MGTPRKPFSLCAYLLLAVLTSVGAARPALAQGAVARPIFVLNSQDASVSVIDPTTFVELRRLPTGKSPHHLYLTPDEKSLIVANSASSSLTLIDPVSGELQRTLEGVADPYYLRVSPDMQWLVSASERFDRIDVYRWNTANPARPLLPVGSVKGLRKPNHMVIDSTSSLIYASMKESDELVAIELASRKIRWRIPVGKAPADVYLTPDDRLLLVAVAGEDGVDVLDVSQPQPRFVRRIQTGAGAHALRSRGDGRFVFVSNRVANTVGIVDLNRLELVDTLPVPGGPDCIEVLADGKTLLVTSRWAGKLSVIDVDKRSVVRQVRVGRSPHDVWTLSHAPRR